MSSTLSGEFTETEDVCEIVVKPDVFDMIVSKNADIHRAYQNGFRRGSWEQEHNIAECFKRVRAHLIATRDAIDAAIPVIESICAENPVIK